MPAEGLLAHTLVGRFVDHLSYYRQEQINARSGVHTPRSTLAAWSGRAGGGLMPLYEAHRAFVLGAVSTAIEYEYRFEEAATQYGYTQRISFLSGGPRAGRA